MRNVLILLLLLTFLVGCQTKVAVKEEPKEAEKMEKRHISFEEFNKNITFVKKGMSEEKVLELIGKPSEKKKNVWIYDYWENSRAPKIGEKLYYGAEIVFDKGVVKEIETAWADKI